MALRASAGKPDPVAGQRKLGTMSAETRAKHSANFKARWADPAYREKALVALNGNRHHTEATPLMMAVIHRNNDGRVGLKSTAEQLCVGVHTLERIIADAGIEWLPFNQALVRKLVNPTRGHAWSEAQDNMLRTLWARINPQLSSGQIVLKMGLSKNSIVGRVRRLGLPARPSPIIRNDRPKPAHVKPAQDYRLPALPSLVAPKSAPRPRIVAPPPPPPRYIVPLPPSVTPTIGLFQRPQLCGEPDEIAEVRAIWAEQERRFATVTRPIRRRCEWISGDVGHDRIPEFCGEPCHVGSWCEKHLAVVAGKSAPLVFQPFRRMG
jgi:GcrA cell cycle regulator